MFVGVTDSMYPTGVSDIVTSAQTPNTFFRRAIVQEVFSFNHMDVITISYIILYGGL